MTLAAPAPLPTPAPVPAPAAVLLPSGTSLAWPADPGDAAQVRAMAPGTAVALADRRPGGRRRLRRAATRLGVRVDAEYVVLPTWGRATFVAADDPDTVTWLLATFLTTPPRVARGHSLVEGANRLGRRVASTGAGASVVRWVVGTLAPGRLVVGTRR